MHYYLKSFYNYYTLSTGIPVYLLNLEIIQIFFIMLAN